ncbi:unnamed protein product [Schistosoma turkestanicum]|nr:unnamed protein product [Schistosoma turkestanicum]
MKLINLIFLIYIILISIQNFHTQSLLRENQNNASLQVSSMSSSKNRNGITFSNEADERRKEDVGVETSSMFGRSRSRYKHKNRKHIIAKGRFHSRGIGRYGIASSEYTHYRIEGKFDRYGRKRPTKSKFRTHGKEKKYSKKIVDNRFDIKGGLIQERKYRHSGDYQANGSHLLIDVGTKSESGTGSIMKTGMEKSMDRSRNASFDTSLTTQEKHDLGPRPLSFPK